MKAIGKHENIIEYIELGSNIERIFVSTNELKIINYLALEYAVNKTLLEYLIHQIDDDDFVSEKWVRYWFRQILAGLIHMRSTNHSHLDIKCENILLDGSLNIKIADFGYA
jgi:serine/threonine protein kinase